MSLLSRQCWSSWWQDHVAQGGRDVPRVAAEHYRGRVHRPESGRSVSSLIIIDYHWLSSVSSLIIIDYHWLSLIIIDYHWLSLVIIDYHWLSLVIIGYHWLSPTPVREIGEQLDQDDNLEQVLLAAISQGTAHKIGRIFSRGWGGGGLRCWDCVWPVCQKYNNMDINSIVKIIILSQFAVMWNNGVLSSSGNNTQ